MEISRTLSQIQEKKLSAEPDKIKPEDGAALPYYKSCVSKHGPTVYWYKDIGDVPDGFTMFVAHEFFDALPIHKFQVRSQGLILPYFCEKNKKSNCALMFCERYTSVKIQCMKMIWKKKLSGLL